MFRREPRTPKGLLQVAGELQHICDAPAPVPDLEPVRNQMSELISRSSAAHSGEGIQGIIDTHVDSFIADWLQDMLRWHHAALNVLDRLDEKLAPYFAQFAVLNIDERGKLAEIEGVTTHVWGRVSKPDAPYLDPIRDPTVTQSRVPREAVPVDPGATRLLPLVPPGLWVIHGNLSQILGRTWGKALTWVVLLAAAGVDIATFYQVLILVMNVPAPVVWGAVVGFTAVALALAHQAGTQANAAVNPGNVVVGAKATAWACFATWLLLGVTAFIVRFVVQSANQDASSMFIVDGQPQTIGIDSQTTSQHLSALLFLVLYLATGLIAGLAGFGQPDPEGRLWSRAVRKRSRASRRYASSQSDLATAMQLAESIKRMRERRTAAWAMAQLQCGCAAVRLKQEARLMIQEVRNSPPPTEPPPVRTADTDEGATS